MGVLATTACGGSEPAPSEPAAAAPTSSSAPSTDDLADAPEPLSPVSVDIASIDLDEELIDLGLQDDGSLEVPEDSDRVGWFTGGGRPGGPGPVVIAGHVDSRSGPAVFARLDELTPGDDVEVTDSEGEVTTYRVDDVEIVPQDTFPTEAVFGSTPDDELRLITCDGLFDRDAGGYQDNRVVFASAVTG